MKTLLLTLALIATSALASGEKVIYGDDNRVDVYESTNALYQKLSESTAAMIPTSSLMDRNGTTKVMGQPLRSRGFCASERFVDQPTAAMCSGFLVGPKLLVTAGHCIKSIADCNENRWVFGYKMKDATTTNITVPTTEVYKCTKVLSTILEGGNGNDYAIVELEREVTNHAPLKVRKEGSIAVGDEVVVIGHPTGMPTKIADGAHVRSLSKNYFMANLDTYGGNSGSAVFNAKTGLVEGILVRGENDYVMDSTQSCRVSNLCPESGCRGEDVTYIKNVPGI